MQNQVHAAPASFTEPTLEEARLSLQKQRNQNHWNDLQNNNYFFLLAILLTLIAFTILTSVGVTQAALIFGAIAFSVLAVVALSKAIITRSIINTVPETKVEIDAKTQEGLVSWLKKSATFIFLAAPPAILFLFSAGLAFALATINVTTVFVLAQFLPMVGIAFSVIIALIAAAEWYYYFNVINLSRDNAILNPATRYEALARAVILTAIAITISIATILQIAAISSFLVTPAGWLLIATLIAATSIVVFATALYTKYFDPKSAGRVAERISTTLEMVIAGKEHLETTLAQEQKADRNQYAVAIALIFCWYLADTALAYILPFTFIAFAAVLTYKAFKSLDAANADAAWYKLKSDFETEPRVSNAANPSPSKVSAEQFQNPKQNWLRHKIALVVNVAIPLTAASASVFYAASYSGLSVNFIQLFGTLSVIGPAALAALVTAAFIHSIYDLIYIRYYENETNEDGTKNNTYSRRKNFATAQVAFHSLGFAFALTIVIAGSNPFGIVFLLIVACTMMLFKAWNTSIDPKPKARGDDLAISDKHTNEQTPPTSGRRSLSPVEELQDGPNAASTSLTQQQQKILANGSSSSSSSSSSSTNSSTLNNAALAITSSSASGMGLGFNRPEQNQILQGSSQFSIPPPPPGPPPRASSSSANSSQVQTSTVITSSVPLPSPVVVLPQAQHQPQPTAIQNVNSEIINPQSPAALSSGATSAIDISSPATFSPLASSPYTMQSPPQIFPSSQAALNAQSAQQQTLTPFSPSSTAIVASPSNGDLFSPDTAAAAKRAEEEHNNSSTQATLPATNGTSSNDGADSAIPLPGSPTESTPGVPLPGTPTSANATPSIPLPGSRPASENKLSENHSQSPQPTTSEHGSIPLPESPTTSSTTSPEQLTTQAAVLSASSSASFFQAPASEYSPVNSQPPTNNPVASPQEEFSQLPGSPSS